MTFSIITICFNAESTIAPTLRSVAEQSFGDYEHLIQDGASTDNTVTLCQSIMPDSRRKIVSERDGGIYDAMNRAMARAKGEYLIFLNAGDSFPSKTTLEEYVKAIDSNGRPGIVYGQTMLVDEQRRIIGPRHLTAPEQLSVKSFRQGMLVCHQAMAVRRDIAPDYDTRYRFSADFDWSIKCLKASSANVYIATVTAHYLSEGATTANRRKSLIERFRIMCHYYGTLPTLLRHIGFALRDFRRRHSSSCSSPSSASC